MLSDAIAQLNAALRNQYVVDREIGAGGMATVFAARDLKHDRPVAIKVLREEIAATVGADRFLREVRITARLNHPHILPLLDSGQANGQLYYVMPLVVGETLRQRLDREGQLAVDEAIDITEQLADAIGYAHGCDVLHRDIKPENILLEHGHALIADFGIARAIESSATDKITQTGVVVGTASYMSPEQSTGESVDQRSDEYSLACVAYEMLVGEPPISGPNAQSIIARRMTESPRPIRATRELVSAGVDAAIMRALARTPADRFATVAVFATALRASPLTVPTAQSSRRRLAPWGIGVAAIVVAGVALAVMRNRDPIAPPRIAVRPFDIVGSAVDSAFVDGVTDEITTRLAAVSGLRVVSRTSANRFRGRDIGAAELGRQLNADFVLEGTVRGDRSVAGMGSVRVSAELIRARNDEHAWQHVFDATLSPGDIFRIQTDIAEQVASAMNVTLLAHERARVTRAATTDTAARRLYQLGRFQWQKRTPESLLLAQQYFRQAIARDSQFAAAYAGLGDAMFVRANQANPDSLSAVISEAVATLRRSVDLDSTLAEGYAGLGYALMFARYDVSGAERALNRAITLDPAYAPARYWYSQLLILTGDLDGARKQATEALALDPLSAIAHLVMGFVEHNTRGAAYAVPEWRRSAELQPGPIPMFGLALGLAQAGLPADSATHACLSMFFPGAAIDDSLARALSRMLAGHGPAHPVVVDLERRGVRWGAAVTGSFFALTGERDSVIARFQPLVERRSSQVAPMVLYIQPRMRGDARWDSLMRSAGYRPR